MKLFFTSDIHGYFYPSDYITTNDKKIGIFRNLMQINKGQDDLLIDGGDMLYGSALVNYLQRNKQGNKVAEIMNDLGYDIVTVGNHDFNFSYTYLKSYLDNLKAQITCVNLLEDQKTIYPSIIKTVGQQKIAFIGLVTDYVNVWEPKSNLENAQIVDSFTTLQREIANLKSQVDVIVGIYHGGLEVDLDTFEVLQKHKENRAYAMASQLDLDILLTGHQHLAINQIINDTLVIQVRNNGLDLVEIDLGKKLQQRTVKFYHPTMLKNPLEVKYAAINAKVNTWLDMEIGCLKQPLKAKSRVKMAQCGSELAAFFNQVQLYYTKADISVVALSNNPVGFEQKVTRRDVLANYPFPNTLKVLKITGSKLRKCVEKSGEYLEYVNGELKVSAAFTRPKLAHYNFDFYANIDYEFDFHQEVGQRLVKFKYQGHDIQDQDVFTIALNNYRAAGGGEYVWYQDCPLISEINQEIADLIISYFEKVI